MKLEADRSKIQEVLHVQMASVGSNINHHYACRHVIEELFSLHARLEAAETVVNAAEIYCIPAGMPIEHRTELYNKLKQSLARYREVEKK